MKIIHLSHSDMLGGAARASYRLHHALLGSGVDSQMWVDVAGTGDCTVSGARNGLAKGIHAFRAGLGGALTRMLQTGNASLHSPQVLPSCRVAEMNASDADLVNLHWVQHEMLAVSDVPRIRKPVVWTLHDMWAFCGAEHYSEDLRWKSGYRKDNRPAHESRFDLNRWTWNRKRRAWTDPLEIVAPSRWLGHCAATSALMSGWPVTVIPNPIDTLRWQPMPLAAARQLLGLPQDVRLVSFGAIRGDRDHRKGFDLLLDALRLLHDARNVDPIEFVVFGQLAPPQPPELGFPVHYMGHLADDWSLIALYSASDVVVVPSRQEAFGQTASEAHACGVPVVAFDTCGLPDIVEHLRSGYLVRPYDTSELAHGILHTIKESGPRGYRAHARWRAENLFSYPVVAKQYAALYSRLV